MRRQIKQLAIISYVSCHQLACLIIAELFDAIIEFVPFLMIGQSCLIMRL